MMNCDALIFDVDGTLADTEEVHRQAFNLRLWCVPARLDLGCAVVPRPAAGHGREGADCEFIERLRLPADRSGAA